MERELEEQFVDALAGGDPVAALKDLAKSLNQQGLAQTEIYLLFEEARAWPREEGRGTEEDPILDVMDFIVGFCSPSAKLFPDVPYDPRITRGGTKGSE